MSSNDCRKYLSLLVSKPWLLPFVLWLEGRGEFSARDMALGVGVRTPIARRVLWWFTKFGIVEKRVIGERVYYRVTDIGKKLVYCTIDATIVSRKGLLLDYGKEYIVVYAKRTRISWYTVPKEIVDKVQRTLANAPNAIFKVKDLSLSTSLPQKLVVRALRVLSILGRVKRTPEGFKARS
mgnify:CR=1 FL=1